MKDIIETAEKLGKQITASDRFKAVEAARNEIEGDDALQADMKALNEVSDRIAQLEKQVKPVEPDDKRRLRELQEKVTGHPKLQKLARAEADFAELMNRVNSAIHAELAK
ncbi:MAG: YlbF family regulator [Planctomycetota bacterium]